MEVSSPGCLVSMQLEDCKDSMETMGVGKWKLSCRIGNSGLAEEQ